MPWVRTPHWRHEAWIYIYASTLPAFPTPHSSLSPWNLNRTLSQQITSMPSTRTGWWYCARPPMPSSSTLRQGSSPSSPSLMTSNSVLRGLPPYRQQEQIPNITLPEHGRIINNNNDYDNLMAILFPQTNLYSKTITMQHLWIMAQKLRREADRQKNWGEEVAHRNGRNGATTGIVPTLQQTPSKILFSSSMTTHSILPCTGGDKASRTCWTIPYSPTDITTTRRTRKPNHCWR